MGLRRLVRTMLFTPANHARHVEKALSGSADAVILDLEDAVAIDLKPAARALLPGLLFGRRQKTPQVFVRVNALTTPFAFPDLMAAIRDGLSGIVLPKVESREQVATADWLMAQLEAEQGLTANSVELLPIIETAAGLTRLQEIGTASPRVRRLTFGAGDFTLDTNMEWSPANEGVLWGRIQTVIGSRAARLAPPLDTVYPTLPDGAGFEAECRQARRLGFEGKLCLHPDQVEIANQVFTPSGAEVDDARRVLEAFDRAVASGSASIQLDGRFIDYPIAERARRLIETRDSSLVEEAAL
ncbi:MAG: CoA ester lyase [Candidatus Dormiibacter spiritus]|nr:MAG: CoA ester lyase [Candidatus Dormibacteraeota bacterium]